MTSGKGGGAYRRGAVALSLACVGAALAALGAAGLGFHPATAGEQRQDQSAIADADLVVDKAVVIGRDGRVGRAAAAAALGLGRGQIDQMFAATGMIECGDVRGVGQLSGRGNTITSAAHVFFDESGRSRAETGRCVFFLDGPNGRVSYQVTPDAGRCGSTTPYAHVGRHDWAVARLDRVAEGVEPYPIGAPPSVGQNIVLVSFAHRGDGWAKTYDICRVRKVVAGEDGPREIRTDCAGADGMSGTAYLSVGAAPSIGAIHVGFRSVSPDQAAAFSDQHYTYGTATEGRFRQAIAAN